MQKVLLIWKKMLNFSQFYWGIIEKITYILRYTMSWLDIHTHWEWIPALERLGYQHIGLHRDVSVAVIFAENIQLPLSFHISVT